MSGWAGYALGRMAAETEQNHREVVAHVQSRFEGRTQQNLVDALTAKGYEFLDHIKWQEGIMQERKARIATLEEELAQARSDLEGQKELTRQWQEYGDKSDEGFQVLKAWADKAEGWISQYQALYGPLPPEK
ncbi:hypothetical protein AD934_02930 [Gluconobacter oxydans]|uniref:Uncharacterized protein n=2 Tax=Gluconobacter TaxID=441 RepID=A0A149S1T9_GLUOY|nr:hypothetical protein AD934_02930 [Gluconobacter oxydans]KXV50987.1 hypothetical protein AD945_00905 [Gluconobacter albidus]